MSTPDQPKPSSLVTALATTTLVIGIVSFLGAFVPCFGALTLYLSIPSILLGAVTIFIAKSQNAPRGLAVAATVVAGLAAVIAYMNIHSIQSGLDSAQKSLEDANRQLRQDMQRQNQRR